MLIRLKPLSPDILRRVSTCAACLYVATALRHLLMRRPFWLDEQFIITNLTTLHPRALFGPLLHSQAFPRPYLFLLQLIGRYGGYGTLIMRLLPFCFMLAGFLLWRAAVRQRAPDSPLTQLLFTLSWCGSSFLIYYAAELKQYSADVFVMGLCAYLTTTTPPRGATAARALRLIAALGTPFLLSFSYATMFAIPLIGYGLLVRRSRYPVIALYAFSSVTAVSLSYYFDIRHNLSNPDIGRYWHDYFLLTDSPYAFLKSFTEGLRNLLTRWFLEHKAAMYPATVLAPFALYRLIRAGGRNLRAFRQEPVSLEGIALILFAQLAAAGALHLYPFTGARITLFAAPFVFYVIITAATAVRRRYPRTGVLLVSIYTGLVTGTTGYLFIHYAMNRIVS